MILRFLNTTYGQIVAITAAASAITFILFLVIVTLLFHVPPPPPWPWREVYRVSSLVEALQQVPEAGWPALTAELGRPGLAVHLQQLSPPCDGQTRAAWEFEHSLRGEMKRVPPGMQVRACSGLQPPVLQVLVPIAHRTVEIRTWRTSPPPPRLTFPVVGALLFLCVAVAVTSAWASARVIGPLRRLSAKAELFGTSIAVEPIPEEGAQEIRSATRAFNLMQQRIARFVQDRTRMLTAISHDLRTPLTRMRLQADGIGEEAVRRKILRDIGLMQTMVTSALTFLNTGVEEEEIELLDLSALLQTLADEYQEGGDNVAFFGEEGVHLRCRPNAINRALTNLIDNAVHYGGEVEVRAAATAGRVTIEIADTGPGIPQEQVGEVLEPFMTLDTARSRRPGSVGLGLSIVSEIIRTHHGQLTLLPREPHGLLVRILLPGS